MIDLTSEEILTLGQACQLPELQRDGRPPARTTLLRWVTRGCRGVRLESARSGGRRVVTRESVARFLRRLNGGAVEAQTSSKAQARAAAILDLAGI